MAAVEEIDFEPVEEIAFEPISEKIDFQELPEDSGQSRAASAVNRFLKTVQSDIGSTIAGGARASRGANNALAAAAAQQIAIQGAMAGEEIPAQIPRSTPESRARAAEESVAFQTGQNIQDAAKDVFATNPRFQESIPEAVASGLGSVVGLAPSMLAGPAAPIVAGASYGLNAGEQGVKDAEQVIDERIAEALTSGDYAQADKLTKDKAKLAENAFMKNAAIGAVTEGALGVAGRVIPLGKGRTLGKTFEKTLDELIPKTVGPVAKQAIKSAAEGEVREATQETVEQLAQNAAALEYDPERKIGEGAMQAGGVGGAVGAIIGAAAGGGARLNRRLLARERLMNRQTDKRETVADTPDPESTEQAADVEEALTADVVEKTAPILPQAAAALETLQASAPTPEASTTVLEISPVRAADTVAEIPTPAPEAPLVEGAVSFEPNQEIPSEPDEILQSPVGDSDIPRTGTKRAYKPRTPEDRPRDIIDDYEENDGRKISITEARKLISDFNPTGAIRDLFTADGINPDEASKSVPKQPIDEDFLSQLQAAADTRIGQRAAKRAETKQLDALGESQLQTEDFDAEISKPKEGSPGVSTEGLFEGSEFELNGEKMRVKSLHFDPDSGDLAFVEIQDGRRFGTQTVGADRMIFPDPGTFKENAPSVDFEPFGLEPAESVEDQKARFAADKSKSDEKARKDKLDELARKPLKGTSGDLGQGDLLKPADDLFAPPTPKPRVGQYAADSSAAPQTRSNLFDPNLTDEEIAAFFDPDPAPGRPGEFRPTSRLSFATYDEFRDWMNARFAENDLEGLTDGIKDSLSAFKVRYIKENRGGDPNLRDVLSHLATASPLPAGWAPVPRTTPRPNPPSMGGSRAPTSTPPPSRPSGPPPPPRTPTPHERFSIPALVQLHRLFGKYPRINRALKSAYGHFKGGEVALKQRMLWDKDLATRVLSHEIGHFIDLAIERFGKGRQFANRWQPLRSFKKMIAEKIAIRRAAVSLSRDWRGPFSATDKYRNRAEELFADAMSAILTNPQWVSDRHPIIHDTFQGLLAGKPAFRTAYDQVTAWLRGDELASVASGQMRQGFQTSRRKLAEGEKRALGNVKDWFKQIFVDPWFRVADIEGNPRDLGKRGIDVLGSLRALPARMNALMKDDFLKDVQPLLDKIQGGGEKARDIFAELLLARRVINERRAAGQWIEQNPDDAYKLIDEILKNHAGLRSRWGGQFAALGTNPTGTQLYDFAAAMFREVHDMGEAMVKSVEDTIDDLKLGVSGDAALMAFNVRGKLLNPSGLDVNEAQNILNRIDSSLTPTQRADLDTAARNFYDIAHKTMEMAHDMGLISDKAWNEIVLPNRYNYVPFAVAEYWDGHVGAAMKPQYGTAKDVIDPVIALQQKLASMHRWIQRQAQVRALIQAYANGGHTVTPTKRLQQVSDIHKERQKNRNDDTSRLVLWRNGQPWMVEFPEDPMHSFETAMEKPFAGADFARMWYSSQLGFIPEASGWMLALYTTLSPSFFLWRNPVRDTKTTAQHTGYSRTARVAGGAKEIARLAWNYAQAGFGKPMDPEVRAFVEKGVLPPPRSHHLLANSPEELEQMILRGRVMASEIALYRNSRRHGRLAKAIQPVLETAEAITATQEAASKILAYKAAKLKPGISDEKAVALAKRSGIPMPGIQGTASWIIEQALPWTRVHIQGVRSTFDIAKDPEMGKDFIARVAMFEFAPRLAKYLFASGLAGMVLGGDKDEDAQDGVAGTIGEFYRRASPYKVAVDHMSPLAWFDTRTGQYHPIYETFKMKARDIPKHWEAVSVRPPSSEEGKLWGSLFYGILAGMTPGQTGRSGQNVAGNAMDWIKSQAVTGFNPGIKAVWNALQLEGGENVKDDFRGQPIAHKDLYAAGGVQKQQAIIGATLNQFGDAGKLAALGLETVGLPVEATQPTQSSFSGRVRSLLSTTPVISSTVSFDNYAQFRDQKVADIAEERSRAQIRLLMTSDVREMYDFLNKHRGKLKTLDARDRVLYDIASDWNRDVYGNAVQEGTIVNRALAAVEKDGSLKAKDTLRRDLVEKSAVYLKQFQQAK